MLNIAKGEMYPFLTHTYNIISGKCEHNCKYCYMLVFPQRELHFSEKAFKTDLGEGNFIFIGSSTDMFADNVPSEWIRRVLDRCMLYDNTYLFQTKNPKRFKEFSRFFPLKTILGVTIETDMESPSQAPSTMQRYEDFLRIQGFDKMISIEPVIDFNFFTLLRWIKEINPKFVSIGADSKGHHLKEPDRKKIDLLISELKKFTEVIIKKNLERIK